MNLLRNSQYLRNIISLFGRSVGVLLPLVYKKTQNFTIINHQYSISIVEVQMSPATHPMIKEAKRDRCIHRLFYSITVFISVNLNGIHYCHLTKSDSSVSELTVIF